MGEKRGMKKAIIVGATSGIGRALAIELSQRNFSLGLLGRNEAALAELSSELPNTFTQIIDISVAEEITTHMDELISRMGGMDLLIIASGIGDKLADELCWENEERVLAVNISGFARLAVWGYNYFTQHGGGHLVGISSIVGIRGARTAPAYSASKAFQINYLEALRGRARHQTLPIYVTDIRPGFVDTPMTSGQRGMFWVADVARAARQIADAISNKKRVAYITRRWRLIAWLLRHLPDALVEKI